MFKYLEKRWAIPSAIIFVCVAAVEVLDWWERVEFVGEKVTQFAPFVKPCFDFVVSGAGRTLLIVAGFVLLFVAISRKSRRTQTIDSNSVGTSPRSSNHPAAEQSHPQTGATMIPSLEQQVETDNSTHLLPANIIKEIDSR